MNNKLFSRIANEATDIRGGTLAMLWLMCFYANDKGECWPRMWKLAKHMHSSERYARILVWRLIKLGYVRVQQSETAVSPPVFWVRIPDDDDTQIVSVPLHKKVRSDTQFVTISDIKRVPTEAGTNLNHIINHKDDQGNPLDKREKRKCGKVGCARVGFEEYCAEHAKEGSRG